MPVDYRFADILKGASINQLSQLFELDRRTVTTRLRNTKPSGERDGFKIYSVKEAAAILLERYVYNDAGELVKNSKHKDEPEKDFWDAQLKKQKFEENAGDLWRTDKVVTMVSAILKQFRESMTVFMDQLEFESGLPPEAVAKAKMFSDNLLLSCRNSLLELNADALDGPSQDESEDTPGDDQDFSDIGL